MIFVLQNSVLTISRIKMVFSPLRYPFTAEETRAGSLSGLVSASISPFVCSSSSRSAQASSSP